MRFLSFLLIPLLFPGICRAVSAAPATQPDASAIPPAKLAPFADLAASAQTYHSLRTGGHWETICDERFSDSAGQEGWQVNNPASFNVNMGFVVQGADPSDNAPSAKPQIVDGQPALVMDASKGGIMQVSVGPPMRCDMAVEMVARHLAGPLNEMTLVLDGIDVGPGFRFGCQQNMANELWIPRPPTPPAQNMLPFPFPVALGTQRLIQGDSWTRIRMEVRDNILCAIVDGQFIGSTRLEPDDGFSHVMHQVNIFTQHSSIAVRQVLLQHYAVLKLPVPDDQAWWRAFGSVSRQQVNQEIADVIDLMTDDDPQVRDAAQRLLLQLGDVAIDPLKQAAAQDQTELRRRANWILNCLTPDIPKVPPLPPELARFQFGMGMWGQNLQVYERQIFMQLMLNAD